MTFAFVDELVSSLFFCTVEFDGVDKRDSVVVEVGVLSEHFASVVLA